MRRTPGRQTRLVEDKANAWRPESAAIQITRRSSENGACELCLQDVLALLHRRNILERGSRARGGIRVTEERELQALRILLEKSADAVKAIVDVAARLDRPVDSLSPEDLKDPD
jgi:hypothetical protein